MSFNSETVSLILGLIVFVGVYIWSRKDKGNEKQKKIPGPKLVDKKLGHSLDLQAAGNMSQYLRKMHKIYGPVFGFYQGSTYTVSLGSPSAFNQSRKLFDRPQFISDMFGPLFGTNSIEILNGTDGKTRHSAYTRFLNFTAISPFFPMLYQGCIEICERWATKQGAFAVSEDLRKFSIRAVETVIFRGYVPDDKEILELTDTYEECWAEVELWLKGDMMEPGSEREKQFKHNKSIINSKVRDAYKISLKNNKDGDNTFQSLATDLGLEEDAILDDIVTFVIGGFHNSSYVMEWGIYFLAKYPDIQEKLYREVSEVLGDEPITPDAVKHLVYLRQFIDELQRWVTIGQIAARAETHQVEIDGYIIPPNTPIVQALETVHFDESIYPDPERFDPERFAPEQRKKLPPHSFEPFGFSGGRRCVGSQVFLNETTILFTTLVQKLRISLGPNHEDIKKQLGTFSRPNQDVYIEVTQRYVE